MSARGKARGKSKSAKGKFKEAAGRLLGRPLLRDRGKGNQISGDLRQAGQKVKDAFKH